MSYTRRSRKYRPYKEKKSSRRRLRGVLWFVLLLFLVYQIITAVFLGSFQIGSESMRPSLSSGQRIFVSPIAYEAKLDMFKLSIPGFSRPGRGDMVLIETPYAPDARFFKTIARRITLFFTLGRVDTENSGELPWRNRYVIRRIIALPGESVKIEDYTAYVKTKGGNSFESEHELSAVQYEILVADLPENWKEGLPFGGRMDQVILKENEYFILADSRVGFFDSRHWGPVTLKSIRGKVLFRYLPVRQFGVP